MAMSLSSGYLMKAEIFVICLVGLLGSGTEIGAQSVRVLSSDLAATMICKDRNTSALEDPIEGFLRSKGFRVLNVARIQRQHDHAPLLELWIVGLDEQRRVINLRSLPFPKDKVQRQGRYSVGYKTPPPTQHASEMEDALLDFFSSGLHCEVRDVTRHENKAEVADLYDQEVARVEKLFREADELNGLQHL
jgi:hypothetical protein